MKTFGRAIRFGAAVFLLASHAVYGQGISGVVVLAPQPIFVSGQQMQLEALARDWLTRLAASYEAALPDDPEVQRAFFPDLVGAVADGRVVLEAAVG